jgi:hypothetical protein
MWSKPDECALGLDLRGNTLRILFLLGRSKECQQRVGGPKSRGGMACSEHFHADESC